MGAGLSDRPLIGISTSEMRVPAGVKQTPQGEPARRELALGLSYPRAIELAGAIPVVLAPLEPDAIDPLIDRLSGLCLSGGPDLHPSAYGEEDHPELGPTEPELDRFELALTRRALERELPVLGICRGAQVLNVARGGTLHQHIPELPEIEHEHRQRELGGKVSHPVRIERGSRLAGIVRRGTLGVNSFHHQAVSRLGTGLVESARSADGVVEAIEDPTVDLCLGVQWHAETLVDRRSHAALFEALTASARRRESSWTSEQVA